MTDRISGMRRAGGSIHGSDRSLEADGEVDDWENFAKALVKRFTDRQEEQRDHEKIKKLRYEGLIQDYLSRLGELNSRVGKLWTVFFCARTAPRAICI